MLYAPMYAIISLGGRQWKVEPGTRLEINRVPAAAGGELPVDRILAAHDGTTLHVGRPYVEGATVLCEVLEHCRGPKVISYHYRRRENWRKIHGHRQPLSRLVVKEIRLPGQAGAAPAGATETAAQPPKPAAPKGAAKPAVKRRPRTTKERGHGA